MSDEHLVLAVIVKPKQAFILSRVLSLAQLRARLDDLGVPSPLWGEVTDVWAAVHRLGNHAVSRAGNDASPSPETDVRSGCKSLMAPEVAALLGVSDRRVRQLAAAGELPGRRDDAGRWRFEPEAVAAFRAQKGEST